LNYKVDSHKEKITNNVMIYIEDDYRYEINELRFFETHIDKERINKLKKIVNGLKDEKIGIVYRNNHHCCETDGICAIGGDKTDERYDNYIIYFQNLPIVLSSFSNNKMYTQYVLDSLKKKNDANDLAHKVVDYNYIYSFSIDFSEVNSVKLSKEEIKAFEYITAHFNYWGNIYTFSGFYPGLLSGEERYTWKYYSSYNYLSNDFEKNNRNEKFDSRMSYLDFINERFEKAGNDHKIVIWYSDDPYVKIQEELKKNKNYCDKNKMTILPLDNYSEEELISEVKKLSNQYSKEVTIVDKEVIVDDSIIETIIHIFIIIVFLLFVFEWRLGA